MHKFVRTLPVTALAVLSMGNAIAHPGGADKFGCHDDTAANLRHCHADRAKIATPPSAHPPRAGDEGIFDGSLLWVMDGDSLRVLVRGREMDVRLADIDAPESDQPFGWPAKLQLIDLVRGKHVVLAPRDVDQYGRIVARVWVGDLDINRELVRLGVAWFYPQYADDESLYLEEQKAREAKRGLWTLPVSERVEPWEWRRRSREDNPSRSK